MPRTTIASARTSPSSITAVVRNFFKCDEGSGNTITATTSGAAVITDTGFGTWAASPTGAVFATAAAGQALTLGSFEAMTDDVDMLIMALTKPSTGIICNFGIGRQPNAGPNLPNVHWSITGAAGIVCSDGDGSTDGLSAYECVTKDTIVSNSINRIAFKCETGRQWYGAMATSGNDVIMKKAVHNDPITWGRAGNFGTLPDEHNFQAFGSETMTLYGFMMVEFPNGMPADVDDIINTVFTEWEADNKIAWPGATIG